MGDFEDSYLTYSTTGGEGASSSSRSFSSDDSKNTTKLRPQRALPAMSRTNFYIMLKDKLKRWDYVKLYFPPFVLLVFLSELVIRRSLASYVLFVKQMPRRLAKLMDSWEP